TEELFHHAGGLAPINPIFEAHLMPHSGPRRVGPLERLKGIGEIIFKCSDFRKGEVLILISNSGINPSTVELAQLARNAGLFTVAITSLTHSKSVPSRGDKKLYEVCDAVIDTGTPVGDACVPIQGHDLKVAPLSSAVSIVAAEMLVVRVSELFAENGEKPPVFQSANTPGGVERNKSLEECYRTRVPLL
ncbi:MAG: sugar isomerase domain-containing protein, partial [Bdellovibrionales bacterium]